MSRTMENLEKALAEESLTAVRYMAFAEQADREGYENLARLFRAAANSALVHARRHLSASGEIGDTPANLAVALEEENRKSKRFYPVIIKDAVDEGMTDVRHGLEYAMSIEMLRAKLLKKAAVDPGGVPDTLYYVCPVCGFTAEGAPPNKCPYCGVDATWFEAVS